MGFPKAMMAQKGKPIICEMAEKLEAAGYKLAAVVVGDAETGGWVTEVLQKVTVVVNHRPQDGMISSIRLGLRLSNSTWYGMLTWPVDHPLITADTLSLIRQSAEKSLIAIPAHNGHRGHPTWWGRQTWRYLWGGEADFGANRVLLRPDVKIREVAVADPGVLINIDTPAELAANGLMKWT